MKKLKGALIAMFFLCLSAAFACGPTGTQSSSKESSSESVLSSESSVESSEEASSESSVESSEEASSESSVESSEEASTDSSVESSEETSTDSSVESSEEASSESSVESSEEASTDSSVESSEETSTDSSDEDSSDPIPVPPVSQGDDRTEMPTYDGNATDLGFPEGTETVYTIVGAEWSEEHNISWDNRIIIQTEADKDYLKFDVVFSADDASLTIWPGANGSYSLSASGLTTSDDKADPTRKAFIVDASGFAVSSLKANTLYTIYFYVNAEDPSVEFNAFKDMTTYVANIEFGNGDVSPIIPNFYMQDTVTIRPVYAGEVTEIGFAEGTTAMVLETTGGTWNDGAYVRTDAETNCLTVNFALSAVPASGLQFRIHAWYDGVNDWIKSIVDCEASDNMVGLPKDIEVLNADGTPVTAWEANTVYTLKIYHGGAHAVAICMDETTFEAGACGYFDNNIINSNDEYVAPVLPEPTVPSVSQGDDRHAMPVYTGAATDLGFPEGTETVYELVTTPALGWTDRMIMQADSTKDYMKFDIILSANVTYLTLWAANEESMFGSYLLYPNGATTTDADPDRKIYIVDENGLQVTSLKANTLYTVYFYLKEVETNVQFGAFADVTVYVANIECADGDVKVIRAIQQGDATLPTYTGDEMALGFEEGTLVQYMVTETLDDVWNGNREPISGKTREELSAKIFGEVGKYVTVKFAVSEDIASGSVFYVWGMLGGDTHTQNGGVSFTTTTHGRIMDEEGNLVTSLTKNTVYVLELYIEGTDTYKVANICNTGMQLYFATESITCSDKSMVVEPEPDPGLPTISSGALNAGAVSVYEGDVTALGFAEGTSVYEYVCADSGTDKAVIKVDPTYDYVDVEFVIAEGDGYFFLHGLKNGSYYNNGVSYVIDASWIRLGDGNNTVSDRTIEVFDADGNKVTAMMENDVVYTLRVYVKLGELDQIMISKTGSTIYFGNVTYGNDVVEDVEPEVQA